MLCWCWWYVSVCVHGLLSSVDCIVWMCAVCLFRCHHRTRIHTDYFCVQHTSNLHRILPNGLNLSLLFSALGAHAIKPEAIERMCFARTCKYGENLIGKLYCLLNAFDKSARGWVCVCVCICMCSVLGKRSTEIFFWMHVCFDADVNTVYKVFWHSIHDRIKASRQINSCNSCFIPFKRYRRCISYGFDWFENVVSKSIVELCAECFTPTHPVDIIFGGQKICVNTIKPNFGESSS